MANKIGEASQTIRISTLLKSLKDKVRNFAVIDRQNQQIGKVQDLIVDANRQLNLVISKQVNQQVVDRHPLFRLRSQRITKIDNPKKSVFIDLEKSEIEYMPEYLETAKPDEQQLLVSSTEQSNQTAIIPSESETLSEIAEENTIRLLEERLVIDSRKHKVGEVVVRKEIETKMVQVPVRREKLIVEQVSPKHQQLAEIDLGQGEITGIALTEGNGWEIASFDGALTVSGEFSSPKIASLLLNAIALEHNHGCKQVRVTIHVDDESHQQKYQEWFNRCSKGQKPKPAS
ncbi:YsnF/AvaK domain-containing protein [Cylindrospermum sp. FACHB-282]|uniref:YsnF/AvaK domain-containing protein n=1 Tax=Cylindrospermum sp. FACHB-282 TaxID=2692794 RepID=UPI00168520CA|nr:DUF2382 domain-containing protein [Cylindrospermum sp. FACHB-282]MBD2386869.1 DUF2382 domain-containing protein [Cylindrospermum sp. FACHB-282]